MSREIYVVVSVDGNRSLSDGLVTSVYTSKRECIDFIILTLIEYEYFSGLNGEEERAREEEESIKERNIEILREKIDKDNGFDRPDLCFFHISKHTI